jgi:hypothetical protein
MLTDADHQAEGDIVGRRTDLELLIAVLRTQPGEQASRRRAATLLGWDEAKVARVAAKGNDDSLTPIHIAPGGVIKHRGSERGVSAGIYADVARVIIDYWGPRARGLRNIEAIHTARSGRRNEGVWSHPDLVIAADPPRRKSQSEPRRLHAIEVETTAGFDLRSVYQAHAQGRDADYAWVFGNKAPGVDKPDWDRVLWTAEELGVGLVTFDKPHVYGTWKTHRPAEHQAPTLRERELFLDRTMTPRLRAEYAL